MLTKRSGPATAWMWAYILINVFATLWMLYYGELVGDLQGHPLQNSQRLIFSCVVVVASYWLILGPGFDFVVRLPSKPLSFQVPPVVLENRLGIFFLVAQLAFILFNLSFGVNIAGSGNVRAESALGLIWVLLPIDSLFLVYYATARESKFFGINLLIYVVSNVARGWSGIFFFIIFLEMCKASRERRVKWKYLLPIGLIAILIYPIILNLKWVFRAAAATDFSVAEGIVNFAEALLSSDYLEVISSGVMQIVGRLQITSLVSEVIRYSSQVQQGFELGSFKPFWLEGLHGIFYDRLMFGGNRPNLGVAFTTIGDFGGDFELGSWNTNTGWVGWLFVAPIWTPFLLLYTGLLCYLSTVLAKKIGMNLLFRDLLWLTWLAFLIPGWLGAFVGFIYTLVVFLALKLFFAKIPRVKIWESSKLSCSSE